MCSRTVDNTVLIQNFSTVLLAPTPLCCICTSDGYTRTHEGWLYLTVVIALYSRAVVGWSMNSTTATELMLDVHEKGRAVVSNGTREKAELDVFRLHEHGLWATMQRDDA